MGGTNTSPGVNTVSRKLTAVSVPTTPAATREEEMALDQLRFLVAENREELLHLAEISGVEIDDSVVEQLDPTLALIG